MPLALRRSNNLTVSAWYRATSGGRDEIVSGGDQYVLRLIPNQIEFSKRISGGSYVQCLATVSGHFDGNWHHVAGVTSTAGMKVYFDGVETCSNGAGDSIVNDLGPDLFVGRHGFNQIGWDFDGNIDDVRIYGRALPASEISYLAKGNR